jgi:hypothetical protein
MEGEERTVIAIFRLLIFGRELNRHVLAVAVFFEPTGQKREHSVAIGLIELLVQTKKQVALDVNCSCGVCGFVFGSCLRSQLPQ